MFVGAAVAYSFRLRCGRPPFPWMESLVAFACVFLLFLEIRIADEFKDREDDACYRRYRPVPRGLVTLSELRAVGAAAGFVQLALVLWLDTALVPLLLAVWAYLALMTKEFFARVWLRAHPIAYLGTHMLNIPLITVFATAFDWRVAREPLPPGLLWMPATTFFVCLGLEIGRKIRAAADEEHGVETYSLLWGRNRAAAAWTAALLAAGACGLGAAGRIGGVGHRHSRDRAGFHGNVSRDAVCQESRTGPGTLVRALLRSVCHGAVGFPRPGPDGCRSPAELMS